MKDPRINLLGKFLVNYSCSIQPGENVLIEAISIPIQMITSLIREVKLAGGTPFVNLKDDQIIRELNLVYDENDIKLMAEFELYNLRQMDAFISIRGFTNINELSDVPLNRMRNILKYYIQPVHLEQRNEHTKWVALRWPTPSMAQRAGMSSEEFEDYFFNVCSIDYAKMEEAMEPLAKWMAKTDQVKIIGPNDTHLEFSINGMPQIKYAGRHNLPDGELFTAPIKESVKGRIQYNVPSVLYGINFENIIFDFQNGKIVNATSNHNKKLNEILDQDEGARYIGEFAFGFHPYIRKPINDVLYDEKIMGSIHLTPGNAYKESDNGNQSALHWDLIMMQTPEMGGGEIYFDNTLIRKDGRFVLEDLEGLNPENLK